MKAIKILQSGFLSTIQDLGRVGFQQYGVPVSGAMDAFSLRAGNRLVNNIDNAAAIEATLIGPKIEFLCDCVLAITGGNLHPKINGRAIPMWKTLSVSQGSVLSFGPSTKGCRSYICIAGGIDVPLVMGSRSTFLRGKIGGLSGRALQKGDTLHLCEKNPAGIKVKELTEAFIPDYRETEKIRVIMGPQANLFAKSACDKFLSAQYTVTNNSDRMGYRLEGLSLDHKNSADIISDAIAPGSIQVPGDGNPIIMLSDRQTTGGYPKIATVITADLPLVAQMKPKCRISFQEISLAAAHQALKEQEQLLQTI